jgi:hypothetical protein
MARQYSHLDSSRSRRTIQIHGVQRSRWLFTISTDGQERTSAMGEVDYLNELAKACHKTAKDHGFWDSRWLDVQGEDYEVPSFWSERIALMHSELSEMLEALRDGDEALLAEECADVAIRLFDFCGGRRIDLQMAVEQKMAKNETRPFKHGRKF